MTDNSGLQTPEGVQQKKMEPMTADEVRAHPEYPHVHFKLEPQVRGFSATKSWLGKVKIAYEIHGKGPKKLVFVSGLGGRGLSWQHHIKYFGHDHADEYTVLIFDNRGIGESDCPYRWYSTSIMAQDVINLLNLIGWTGKRELNIAGSSMGGMIAQEIAYRIPERINSLMLLSTASKVINEEGLLRAAYYFTQNIIAPEADENERLKKGAERMLSVEWLDSPDDVKNVTVCNFPLNRDRTAAHDIYKREHPHLYPVSGFLLQLMAASQHNKTPAQLEEIAKRVDPRRIMVVHGSGDITVKFYHSLTLAQHLGLIAKIDESRGWEAKMDDHEDPEWAGQEWSNWKVLTYRDENDGGREKKYNVKFIRGHGHIIPIEMKPEFQGWMKQMAGL